MGRHRLVAELSTFHQRLAFADTAPMISTQKKSQMLPPELNSFCSLFRKSQQILDRKAIERIQWKFVK